MTKKPRRKKSTSGKLHNYLNNDKTKSLHTTKRHIATNRKYDVEAVKDITNEQADTREKRIKTLFILIEANGIENVHPINEWEKEWLEGLKEMNIEDFNLLKGRYLND